MSKYSSTDNALIVFADLVDSSVYSSLWGVEQYANTINKFQELFEILAKQYFKPASDPVSQFCLAQARGDEGIIFCIDPDTTPKDLVYRAVQFSFALKSEMELLDYCIEEQSPKKMKVGVGIHFGEVALFVGIRDGNSIIEKIEGYSINYAKRVESCSRIGKYSRIFLSERASHYLMGDPIVMYPHAANMKGIGSDEKVYEVLSALLPDIKTASSQRYEKLIEICLKKARSLDLTIEAWEKSLIISILDDRLSANTLSQDMKCFYAKIRTDFAWQNPCETDPILLFIRALECGNQQKHTRGLTYLKQILEQHPTFLHVRDKMAKFCWEISKQSHEPAELIFARDMAEELLEHYRITLSNEDLKLFQEICSSCKLRAKSRTAFKK